MRAKQFLPEAPIGVSNRRPARSGSRPDRGHDPIKEGVIDVPAISTRIKAMRAQGIQDAQIRQQLIKEGTPIRFIDQAFAGAELSEEDDGITGAQETKFHAKLDKLVHNTFGKRDDEIEEIAGAFPSPSTRKYWADQAALSNAAEAQRQAQAAASANAERLQKNTELVDKEQKTNYHSLATAGSAVFNYPHVNGQIVRPASTGQVQPADAKLVTTDEGQQVYVWSVRYGQKGDTIQVYRQANANEGFDYTIKDLGNDYAGFPSNHSMKHKMLKRIKPEKHQIYKDKMNNMHEFDQLLRLFKVAQARGDVIEQGVAEGDVVKFPKKHKGDISDMHDCPKCGGDLQGGKYMGHAVQVCMPCKQVYLPPNSGIDQKGNKIVDEISDEARNKYVARASDDYGSANFAARASKSHPGLDDYSKEQERRAEKRRAGLNRALSDKRTGKVNEVAMRMQGSSQSEKDANARAKALEAEEKAKHLAIVQAYVKIMAAGQPLPPKMQQSYNTMPDFKKEVDAALASIPGQPGVVDLEQRKNYHLIPKNESKSKAMDTTAKRLTDPNDGKTTKLRAAGDKRREEHLKSRDIAKKNEAIDMMAAELELMEKATRQLCKSSKPDEDLGASNLASCKSQGLRARDGEKSHLIGHGNSSVRIKVGGKRIKGKKYGGPLPDYGTRKGQ